MYFNQQIAALKTVCKGVKLRSFLLCLTSNVRKKEEKAGKPTFSGVPKHGLEVCVPGLIWNETGQDGTGGHFPN